MSRPDEIDIERLTAALHDRGVRFVGPTPVRSRRPFLSDDSLLRGLAASPEPLHREALIALFLRRPGLAASLASALAGLPQRAGISLKLYYTAAMYLRHVWRTRLELYLGPLEPLPDFFSAELGLPPVEEDYGEAGLRALAGLQGRLTDPAFNYLASYRRMIELLVGQLKLERAHA